MVAEDFEGESTLVFFVNGKKVIDNDVDPEWTLLYYLRNKLRLCGTKLGCAEGGCGACTVLVSRYNRKKKKIIHLAVNACLAAICTMHGCAVTTVEGIGSTRTKLHPVQERLAKAHGSQCGFCTPGIIMSMYALLRANPKPKMLDMEIAFQGNLCRCTGYRPIIEGLRTFTEEWEQEQIALRTNGCVTDDTNDHFTNGHGTNGDTNGHTLGHGTNGHANGHGTNGDSNGHGTNGHTNGHGINSGTNGHGTNGDANGHGINGGTNGHGVNGGTNGHGINGGTNGHGINGGTNGHGTNGDINGHGTNGINGNGHITNGNGHITNGNGHGTNGDANGHGTNGINGNGHGTNGINGNGHGTNGINGNGHITNGNGHGTNGDANGHGTNGHTNGHDTNGHSNGHGTNGHTNGHGTNGDTNGHTNGDVTKGKGPITNGDDTKSQVIKRSVTNGCSSGPCGMGKDCCRNTKSGYYKDPEEILFYRNEFAPYDPSQEAIFPPELILNSEQYDTKLLIKGPRATWYRPLAFDDVLMLKEKYPNAKLINGNSEVGVEVKFKNFVYPVLIHPILVPELTEVVYMENGIKFGAAVTVNEINDILKQEMATQPEWKTRIFKAATGILHWFAGKQIRNVSAIGGNLMTGSPISDMNPVLMAANVDLYVSGRNSERVVKMDHRFFTGYRRNVIKPEEVLRAVFFPYSHEDQYFNAYKQAKRRDDDIAIVNCAANVEFEPGTDVIKNILIAYGGVAPCTTLAMKTRELLLGKRWNDEMVEEAFTSLVEELPLAPSAPGGKIRYRRSLTLSLFFKFYLHVRNCLSKKYHTVAPLPKRMHNAHEGFHSKDLKSSQYFQVVPKNQVKTDPVGRTLVHVNAFKQATGEAIYCDDIPRMENELYLTLVLSTKAHAKILNVDVSAALAMEGVHGYFDHRDIEGRDDVGAIFHDEKVFYHDVVTSQGQVVGAIVADNQTISQRAAKLVKIEYEELSPIIVSMEQAIEHNSFIGGMKQIVRGDPVAAFRECDYIKEGEVKMGGQEHFYLETQCCLVVPREDEVDIYTSTQNAAEVQKLAAHVLGIPCNRVITRVKRIGGGFGGKESRAGLVALPAAIAAYKLKRPIRCMLDRDEDMITSGTRHPFLGKYKVGFNKEGKIIAADVDIYNNGGYSMDLSCGVLDRALFHVENAYYIPNIDVRGRICLTNLPTNTAFRGFGGPQGMFIAETMIDEIAFTLNKTPEEIRYMNLYLEGQTTHYNQLVSLCTVNRCWEECYENSEFEKRKQEVEEFNKKNRYRKRGISLIPTKFGIAFTELSLNQAGALVHIYADGSVLLSHGGVEIGQGLNTKMIQVASRALGVDPSYIYISEMATDKVPNSSATAASAGSDLNGMAVMNACHKLAKRLEPIQKENPNGTWKEWAAKAYRSRIGLSATGFYMTPEIGYSFETNSGMAFNYFTYGAAASVVEIDCLTGDHQVLRTDIVMDLGESLNPAIDIGQVEGAFVQGQGLFTMEELLCSPTGTAFTRGPGVYKIPGFADIPLEFNVSLLRGASNPRAVYSSKAVGEPPLFLASSIFFAIKNAIVAAREEEGITGNFRFDSPATSERIRMYCVDNITRKFPEPDPKSFTPWNLVP